MAGGLGLWGFDLLIPSGRPAGVPTSVTNRFSGQAYFGARDDGTIFNDFTQYGYPKSFRTAADERMKEARGRESPGLLRRERSAKGLIRRAHRYTPPGRSVPCSRGVGEAADSPPAATQALYTAPISGGSLQASAAMTVADYDRLGARARASIDFVEPVGAPFVFHGVSDRAYAEAVDTRRRAAPPAQAPCA